MTDRTELDRSLSRRRALRGMAAGAAAAAVSGLGCGARQVPVDDGSSTSGETAASQESMTGATQVFATVEASGSHREIGRAMGTTLGGHIRGVLAAEPSYERCLAAARGPQRELVARFLEVSRARFPAIVEEIEGMAEGLDVPFSDLFAWNCRSEIGVAERPCPPGCSTVGLRTDETMLLAHNEDGGQAYLGRMFVLRATPPSGIAFAALVYPGTVAGNGPGLNARGVVQTTNYIAPCEVAEGIPRYLVGRAVLEAEDLDAAVSIATTEGRAFPWHHNLASLPEGRLVSLETWPGRHDRVDVEGVHVHTNHLTHPGMLELPEPEEYLGRSSGPRLASLESSRAARPFRSREDLLAALTDHSGRPCRVCRHGGDEVPGVTVAAAIFESPSVEMTLIDGPPCQGRQVVIRP